LKNNLTWNIFLSFKLQKYLIKINGKLMYSYMIIILFILFCYRLNLALLSIEKYISKLLDLNEFVKRVPVNYKNRRLILVYSCTKYSFINKTLYKNVKLIN